MTQTAEQHDAEAVHEHPSEMQYVKIALVLGALTAIEVSLSYAGLSTALTTSALLIFAGIKFAIVAMYFMHLKFDHPVLRRLFVTGIILAIFCYVAYLSTLGVFL